MNLGALSLRLRLHLESDLDAAVVQRAVRGEVPGALDDAALHHRAVAEDVARVRHPDEHNRERRAETIRRLGVPHERRRRAGGVVAEVSEVFGASFGASFGAFASFGTGFGTGRHHPRPHPHDRLLPHVHGVDRGVEFARHRAVPAPERNLPRREKRRPRRRLTHRAARRPRRDPRLQTHANVERRARGLPPGPRPRDAFRDRAREGGRRREPSPARRVRVRRLGVSNLRRRVRVEDFHVQR
jgi:hypothetical protein